MDAARQEIYRTVPWTERRWPEHAAAGPIPLQTLIGAGGRIVGLTGLSGRALIEMPDGSFFEEGQGGDGGCFLHRDKR